MWLLKLKWMLAGLYSDGLLAGVTRVRDFMSTRVKVKRGLVVCDWLEAIRKIVKELVRSTNRKKENCDKGLSENISQCYSFYRW